jgi:hypothetical protein
VDVIVHYTIRTLAPLESRSVERIQSAAYPPPDVVRSGVDWLFGSTSSFHAASGERARAIGGGCEGSPRTVRKGSIVAGSVMRATIRSRLPHSQASTSMSYVRRSRVAQSMRQRRVCAAVRWRGGSSRDAERPPAGVRSEDTVEANQRMARRRNESDETREKLFRLHHTMGLLPIQWISQAIGDEPGLGERKAFETQWWPGTITHEPLARCRVALGDRNSGVHAEAAEVGGLRALALTEATASVRSALPASSESASRSRQSGTVFAACKLRAIGKKAHTGTGKVQSTGDRSHPWRPHLTTATIADMRVAGFSGTATG